MRFLYDFRCRSCGTSTEELVDNQVSVVTCQDCGGEATRLLPAPKATLDPIMGHFPSATDAWIKRRERHMALEQKHSSFNPDA